MRTYALALVNWVLLAFYLAGYLPAVVTLPAMGVVVALAFFFAWRRSRQ